MFPKPCTATNRCTFMMANRKKCCILIGKQYHLHLYISASNNSNWSVSFCPKSQKIVRNPHTHSTRIMAVRASRLQLSFCWPKRWKKKVMKMKNFKMKWNLLKTYLVVQKLLNYLMVKDHQNTHRQKGPREVRRNHKLKDFVELHNESIINDKIMRVKEICLLLWPEIHRVLSIIHALNCLTSEWSLTTRQKCCRNFRWFFGSDNLPTFKWAKSFVIFSTNEVINHENPRAGHAIQVKSAFVHRADTVWINPAPKYPNGVCQSNGNLARKIKNSNWKAPAYILHLHHWWG